MSGGMDSDKLDKNPFEGGASLGVHSRAAVKSELLYMRLRLVLDKAYLHASEGKGKERHANGDAFEDQLIVQIGRHQGGSIDFNTGQACKKSFEAKRLSKEKAIDELLGAINYLAGAVIILEEQK